ncbi:MAG: hypothetical protein ACLPZ0_20205, partial [Steroidobacteraceae bacterium]
GDLAGVCKIERLPSSTDKMVNKRFTHWAPNFFSFHLHLSRHRRANRIAQGAAEGKRSISHTLS